MIRSIIGKKFGKMTVIGRAENDKFGRTLGINVDRVYGFIRRGIAPEEALFK